jgi:hypothetical protein
MPSNKPKPSKPSKVNVAGKVGAAVGGITGMPGAAVGAIWKK